ncbi:MAG: CusA/CzcA family heavy metal efflux RND transporter [Lentisphaeria bacterium]|nr:CusA/CzcA family heavy metal efflux RND transporter [Lentisphaeria bacterium]
MINRIIDLALRQPALVILLSVVVLGVGIHGYRRLPVDAFPDTSPIMVPIFAEAHGLAPEEMERLVSFPIESAMNGLPGVTRVKSTSAFGMAVVYVYFADAIDIYFARQVVSERLAAVSGSLPAMDTAPAIGPISTGLGQVFLYYLQADPELADSGDKPLDLWLRELNDWVVKYQLQSVPGVTDILSIGGHVLQYQIEVDPRRMHAQGISLDDVVTAVQSSNRNIGAQYVVTGQEESLVRGLGLLEGLDELRQVPLRPGDGTALCLGDIAEVRYGPETRRGVVTLDGEREVVSGIVLKLYGANTSEVIARLRDRVRQVQATLPPGVELVPYYDQSELVDKATSTVKTALWQGALLVVAVLILFLGSWRAAFIVALSLPFSAVIAVLGIGWQGLSANLMSLGGIAIAIGMLGDGAIVMVEAITRRLRKESAGVLDQRAAIAAAAHEVSRPIVMSTAIIISVFLPIFTLEGVEGKMFSPMAYAITYALLGALAAALVISPVLSCYALSPEAERDQFLVRWLKRLYEPLLRLAMRHRGLLLAAGLAGVLGCTLVVPRLGSEFIPTLDEGSILIGVTMAPAIALEAGKETIMRLEREIGRFPEVTRSVTRIGRPEAGSHPHPVNTAEIQLTLSPLSRWERFRRKEELVAALAERLGRYPGLQLNFTQPIQNAFDELLSGSKAQLAIKVHGEDFAELRRLAEAVRRAIAAVPGLVDLSVEQNSGQPQVQIVADRGACARHGVSVDDLLETVELAVGGEVIDHLYLNARRHAVHLRYQEAFRADPEALGEVMIPAGRGVLLPLKMLAQIRLADGPIQINRENNQRYWLVQGNIRGRDLGSVVADVRELLAREVPMPTGYMIEFGGQFENQQRAMRRLALIVPAVIMAVMILLWLAFGRVRHALIIIANVPLALCGGVVGLLWSGEYLSVPAAVGFIALFGIAMQNGIVLVSHYNDLLADGLSVKDTVVTGSLRRLCPVLMTALTTVLGLVPLLLARGVGSDVQRPLAIVVVFGLLTSTALTLFVIPAVFSLVEERQGGKTARRCGGGAAASVA